MNEVSNLVAPASQRNDLLIVRPLTPVQKRPYRLGLTEASHNGVISTPRLCSTQKPFEFVMFCSTGIPPTDGRGSFRDLSGSRASAPLGFGFGFLLCSYSPRKDLN